MIETDFGWALAKMRDGYKVRRAGAHCVNFMLNGRIVGQREGETSNFLVEIFASECILAYDWELADA